MSVQRVALFWLKSSVGLPIGKDDIQHEMVWTDTNINPFESIVPRLSVQKVPMFQRYDAHCISSSFVTIKSLNKLDAIQACIQVWATTCRGDRNLDCINYVNNLNICTNIAVRLVQPPIWGFSLRPLRKKLQSLYSRLPSMMVWTIIRELVPMSLWP